MHVLQVVLASRRSSRCYRRHEPLDFVSTSHLSFVLDGDWVAVRRLPSWPEMDDFLGVLSEPKKLKHAPTLAS